MATIKDLLGKMIDKINVTVKTVNGNKPDENGNVNLNLSTGNDPKVMYIISNAPSLDISTEVTFKIGERTITCAASKHKIQASQEVIDEILGYIKNGVPAFYYSAATYNGLVNGVVWTNYYNALGFFYTVSGGLSASPCFFEVV